MSRRDLLVELAAQITLSGDLRIAIDGVDGAGKTTFADDLAGVLAGSHARVLADDHLQPAEVRHARGRDDPEGFWLDSYDHDSLQAAVGEGRLRAVGPGDGRGGELRTRCAHDRDAV